MIQTKSFLGYGVTAVIMMIAAITALSVDTAMNAYAQNVTTPPVAQQQNQSLPQY